MTISLFRVDITVYLREKETGFEGFFLFRKEPAAHFLFQMRMPPSLPPPPPWHAAIARALERGSSTPASRYLQIATIRPDGRPAVRSVVFRGWFDFADCSDGASSAAAAAASGSAASAATMTTPRLGFVTDAR